MAKRSNVIRVPKPAPGSFNKDRPLAKNSLLQNQVRHFHEMEKELPPEHQTNTPLASIQTEGHAAAYIRRMTAKLHRAPAKTRTQRGK
jgi:hypothetical protein